MHTDKLVALLSTFVTVTDTDKKLIAERFEWAVAEKNESLIEHGKTARYLYFIVSGFARVYHFEKGIEITNHLGSENMFITAFNSFTTRRPSEEVVQTITRCQLLRITKDNLNLLYKQSHNMALFGIIMSEQYLVFNNQRAKDLITLTAEEKYRKLLQDEPHILQNVPLHYISSYIGIEPQTLSRIRKKISS